MLTTTVKLAGGAQGFNWLPVFVAEELGLFAEQGLEIEYMRVGTVEKATAAVLEGQADLAITPPEGAIANYLGGGELRILAANASRLPMSVVSQPEIRSLAELRGKRIGTSSLTEGTAVYMQILLARAGLRYPEDYEFVLSGVHTKRREALEVREIDCAPQPAPWSFLALGEGYNLIGEINEVIPEILFTALIARREWRDEAPETAARILKALALAHEVVNDPVQEAIAQPIFQRITMPEEGELSLKGLRYMRDMGMWPEGLSISETALDTTIDVMIQAKLIEPSRRSKARSVFDSSFLTRALG